MSFSCPFVLLISFDAHNFNLLSHTDERAEEQKNLKINTCMEESQDLNEVSWPHIQVSFWKIWT